MAQAMKINVAQAMKMGEKLPAPASVKEQLYVRFVHAKDLTYADPHAWKLNDDIAEFLGGNPQVDGTYNVAQLEMGVEYKVYYYVTMKDHEVSNPVNLKLQLPNGNTKERTETITVDPSRWQTVFVTETITVDPSRWQTVFVGKFFNIFPSGDIKFTFSGVDGDTWKGLLLQYVLITNDG